MLRLIIIFSLLAFAGAAYAAPRLTLGPPVASLGSVSLPLTLTADPEVELTAVALEIEYDRSRFETPVAVAGPAAIASEKNIALSTPLPGSLRVLVIGFNRMPLPDGLLALLTFRRLDDAPSGVTKVRYKITATDAEGEPVVTDVAEGEISVAPVGR